MQKIFYQYSLKIVQEEKDTLTILLNDQVKVIFFSYPYPLLQPLVNAENIAIASLSDIGCMKLSAIVSRSTLKDYVDLYFILQQKQLSELLADSQQKFPQLDKNLILKSLVYFDDVDTIPLKLMPGKEISVEKMKRFLQERVESYMAPLS